jgi:hypothetical protein
VSTNRVFHGPATLTQKTNEKFSLSPYSYQTVKKALLCSDFFQQFLPLSSNKKTELLTFTAWVSMRTKENLFHIQITMFWAFKAVAAVYFSVAGSYFTHLDTAKLSFLQVLNSP